MRLLTSECEGLKTELERQAEQFKSELKATTEKFQAELDSQANFYKDKLKDSEGVASGWVIRLKLIEEVIKTVSVSLDFCT